MKLNLSDVLGQPFDIGFSLEENILPRCAMLSVFMSEGKIGWEWNTNLLWALLSGSKQFRKKYVLRYASDVLDVIKACEGKIKFEGFRPCSRSIEARRSVFPIELNHHSLDCMFPIPLRLGCILFQTLVQCATPLNFGQLFKNWFYLVLYIV